MAKSKWDGAEEEVDEKDSNSKVEGIQPGDHGERMAKDAKKSQERLKTLGGDPTEVEFLQEAVYDSEVHQPGSVVEVPALDARNLHHQGVAKYNAASMMGDKKPVGKKTSKKE